MKVNLDYYYIEKIIIKTKELSMSMINKSFNNLINNLKNQSWVRNGLKNQTASFSQTTSLLNESKRSEQLSELQDFMDSDRFKIRVKNKDGSFDTKSLPRPYTAEQVLPLRGLNPDSYATATRTANKFWDRLSNMDLSSSDYLFTWGVNNPDQLRQMVEQGVQAGYVSGWTISSAGTNETGKRPDLSLWPYDQAGKWTKNLRRNLEDAEIIRESNNYEHVSKDIDYDIPLIIDVESYSGLRLMEMVHGVIESGGSAVHLEDQSSDNKKCGHMGGKSIVPLATHIDNLMAIRLASDIAQVPLVTISRTDSLGAELMTGFQDPRDEEFLIARLDKDKFLSDGFFTGTREEHWNKLQEMGWILPYKEDASGKILTYEGEISQKARKVLSNYKSCSVFEDKYYKLQDFAYRMGFNNLDSRISASIFSQLLNYDYVKAERGMPDIHGNTHNIQELYRVRKGVDIAKARCLATAPYADVLWIETSTPNFEDAKEIAQAVHEVFPDQIMSYNMSPSFNWEKNFRDQFGSDWEKHLQDFQVEMAKVGYKYQFITLAGHHVNEDSMAKAAKGLKESGMHFYSQSIQGPEETKLKEHQSNTGSKVSDLRKTLFTGGFSETTTNASDSDTSVQFKN